MSKRLQILVPDDEYRAIVRTAKERRRTVAELVRDSIRRTLREDAAQEAPERRIAAVLRYAKYEGPTGDIDELLAQIEEGRTDT